PFFCLLITHPPISPLFPYTTLFRSELRRQLLDEAVDVDLADHQIGVAAREREDLARHAGHQVELALDLLDVLLALRAVVGRRHQDRKSTRLNSSHRTISYAVFCLKK